MARQKLYEYAVLFHPKATKEQKDSGVDPNSMIVLDPVTILAYDEKEAVMRVSRELPAEYMDKLQQVEIIIRPF
jgi:hypothetical protein